MGKIIYDFREGLDKEKIIYKDSSCDCASFWKFVGFVLLSWIWMVGWFALFQYSYIWHAKTAFWVYIIVWLVFILAFIIWVSSYLIYSSKKKQKIKDEKRLKEKMEENEEQPHQEKIETRGKNEWDMIELQNARDTEQAFLSKNKA